MRRVVICSPWRGDEELHGRYLRAGLRDSYGRGEAPIASHAIGPLVLDESVPEDRERGLLAGLAWIPMAHLVAVYADLGVSQGMQREIDTAYDLGIPIDHRHLGGEWAAMGAPPTSVAEISDREVCRAVLDGTRPEVDQDGRTLLRHRTRAPLEMCHLAMARAVEAGLVEWATTTIRRPQLTDAGRRLLDGEEPSCA